MQKAKTVVNPYLPLWEYVPDAEPHVFEGRLYVFGSHDKKDGTTFCEEDYVGWSAPIEDLSDWRYEGVIYRKTQDPLNRNGEHALYAPDVAQGPDGRYYLYYGLDFTSIISVAVSDSPVGPYEFHGHVSYADGSYPQGSRMFDPAILCEESGNYLYYGFCPTWRFPGMETTPFPGAMMVELENDMHTIKTEPICVADGAESVRNTAFKEHPFFEASSIRNFNGIYYFVYSSIQSHELCYATSDSPRGPFEYRGVIISNGDVGYRGNTVPVNYMGNNHGGIERIKDQYYIFYHRHTHGTQFSRQGCAEQISISEDGWIPQVEITSCGLNDGPLPAGIPYSSCILCHLTGPVQKEVGMVGEEGHSNELPENAPYITEEAGEQRESHEYHYVKNLCEGAVWGCKYMDFDTVISSQLTLTLRGAAGSIDICISSPENTVAVLEMAEADAWTKHTVKIPKTSGAQALYLVFHNREKDGAIDFAEFFLE